MLTPPAAGGPAQTAQTGPEPYALPIVGRHTEALERLHDAPSDPKIRTDPKVRKPSVVEVPESKKPKFEAAPTPDADMGDGITRDFLLRARRIRQIMMLTSHNHPLLLLQQERSRILISLMMRDQQLRYLTIRETRLLELTFRMNVTKVACQMKLHHILKEVQHLAWQRMDPP